MLLLVAPLLLGAGDGYLREIEEEAKRQAAMLTIDQASSNPVAATATNKGETTVDRLASGLDQAGFEQALRETLPGTYALYQQFDTTRRQNVYAAYQNDNRLTGITEQVIQLLSAKP
jgi:phosphate-selective porin